MLHPMRARVEAARHEVLGDHVIAKDDVGDACHTAGRANPPITSLPNRGVAARVTPTEKDYGALGSPAAEATELVGWGITPDT